MPVPTRERTKERVSHSVPTRERTKERVSLSVPTRERTKERVSLSVSTRERTQESNISGLLFALFAVIFLPNSFDHQQLSPLGSISRLNSFTHRQLTPLGSISRLNSFTHRQLTPLGSVSRPNSFTHQHLSPLASISRQKSSIAHYSLLIAHWMGRHSRCGDGYCRKKLERLRLAQVSSRLWTFYIALSQGRIVLACCTALSPLMSRLSPNIFHCSLLIANWMGRHRRCG
jgi:hypothetical protein